MRPIASPIRMSVTASKSAARRMYSPIAVRAILTDRAITRSLAPHASFRRRYFSNLPYRQSLGGHRVSFANRKEGPCPAQTSTGSPPHPFNRVAALPRNRWPLSIGMGGRFPSKWVAALPRIPQGDWLNAIGVDDWAWPARTRTVDCAAFRRRLLSNAARSSALGPD
jgi:hypothetical protein